MTEQEIRQLKQLLGSAVESAYAERGLLLKSDGSPREGNEQTIAFRVGIYLHELLKNTPYAGLNLDCEYNKHGDDPKERLDGSKMRPDLLIHRRGNNDHNIMAVEFAGWWKEKEKIKKDREKLSELTNLDGAYRYNLGILVHIEEKKPRYEFFIKN